MAQRKVQWWIPIAGLAATATLVTAGFGLDIHHDTGNYARAALADAGLDSEVALDHAYRDVTLTGPASLEDAAVAAVTAAALVKDVEYIDNGELSAAEVEAAEIARQEAELAAEVAALEAQAEAAFAGSASIGFKSGSDVLTGSSSAALDDIAAAIVALLQADPAAKVAIEGHTDAQGDADFNLELSQERADAVRDYLVGRGVEPGALTATGYGEARPVASNDTDKGRAANRRVTITLLED